MGSGYHSGTTATSAAARCNVSGVSESQQLSNPICLVKARVTRLDRAQHEEGNRLQFSEGEEWDKKGPDSKIKRQQKRRRQLVRGVGICWESGRPMQRERGGIIYRRRETDSQKTGTIGGSE